MLIPKHSFFSMLNKLMFDPFVTKGLNVLLAFPFSTFLILVKINLKSQMQAHTIVPTTKETETGRLC